MTAIEVPLYRRLAVGAGAAALVVFDVATLGFVTLVAAEWLIRRKRGLR